MKILLAESEMDLGIAIYRILSQENYIVDWVHDGIAAWNYLDTQHNQYTLAIVDCILSNLTGLKLCERLREQQNPLPMLMLTAQERWEDGISGLDAGADDYLIKPFRTEELLARLRALRRRVPYYQPLQLQFGNLTLDCDNRTVCWQSSSIERRQIRLSKKEFQVLEYFMRQPRQEVSQDQLLDYLYEMEAERISNVVAAQVRRLRCKLAELGCEDAIQTVPGGRYRLNPTYVG